ncbi:proline--tRNA ligase [Candidatus Saccharibacteria bacterium]|nr:MAG: proline--tRNA ligase [Candidatus Saccharibacteria bacterium]
MTKNLLPNKTDDPSEWYIRVIQLAELADYGPSKGTMIMRPYSYAIWEYIQKAFDNMIKEYGVENAYFPLFIPMSYLEREASHVEGFAPELAVVTHGGGQKLEEALVVRPTSETIINASFTKWVQSHRDLPIMLNQWCNAVRWEKRTLPFLRTSEFLWQEGHTVHATHEEAISMQRYALDSYAKLYREYFALDGYIGRKSKLETFAGADETLTYETMLPSGKALQSCTSHDLGQNFAKAFDTQFQDENGDNQYVWQTSWGLSTRSIGGLIMGHGDNNGLVLPPRLAPTQVVIVPINLKETTREYVKTLEKQMRTAGIRTKSDMRDDERFGYKLNKWEVKGVPLIVKVGDNEVAANKATIKRRDNSQETIVDLANVESEVRQLLENVQSSLLANSRRVRDENTREASNYEEMKQILADHKGFVKVYWNDNPKIEAKIKEETKAVSRCCIEENAQGTDFYTGEPASEIWLFAQSY